MFSDVNPFGMVAVVAIVMTSGFFFSVVADLASWLMSFVAESE